MNDKRIKVTDKRMFTPDGELRDEYKDMERDAPPQAPGGVERDRPPQTSGGADRAATRLDREEAQAAPFVPPQRERPKGEPSAAEPPRAGESPTVAPTFLDLVGTLTEPIVLFLGDARLPDGGSTEDLDRARHYIDLLDVLRTKTEGNLDHKESAFLDDLLYQLRLRYVQKRG